MLRAERAHVAGLKRHQRKDSLHAQAALSSWPTASARARVSRGERRRWDVVVRAKQQKPEGEMDMVERMVSFLFPKALSDP